ncbi:MAG: phosphopantetheine adenylyltransferase [Candidatus Bathyarchaeota archaeon B63]|nr:MAG: phosphopantetheine adenylyltransferase [Candidatus Bathyarchaeota archaeon B63]
MKRRFRVVGVGGTFDEFHRGHRTLLEKAFEVGDLVWIGLSTDEFARKLRKGHEIASYEARERELRRFLEERGFSSRVKITPLRDPYGPAATSKQIEAIVVSRETEPAARRINLLRRRNRLRPLEVIVIDMVPAENHIAISTTRIRRGEINREGHLIRKP